MRTKRLTLFFVLMLSGSAFAQNINDIKPLTESERQNSAREREAFRREMAASGRAAYRKKAKLFISELCKARQDKSIDDKSCNIRNESYQDYMKYGRIFVATKVCKMGNKADAACLEKALELINASRGRVSENSRLWLVKTRAECSPENLSYSECLLDGFKTADQKRDQPPPKVTTVLPPVRTVQEGTR